MLRYDFFAGFALGAGGQSLILACYSVPPMSLRAGLMATGLTLAGMLLMWLAERTRGPKPQENICENEKPIFVQPAPGAIYVCDSIHVALSYKDDLARAAVHFGGILSRRTLASYTGMSYGNASKILDELRVVGDWGRAFAEFEHPGQMNSATKLTAYGWEFLGVKPPTAPQRRKSAKLRNLAE